MTRTREPDWEPRSDEVQANQVASYDAMRDRCPIAYDGNNSWTVFGHADTVAIVDDVDTFSNNVSRHLQVPNGIDGEQHRRYRGLVDTYFTEERLAEFEPTLRQICTELVASVPRDEDVDFMAAVAEPFANNVSCAFMGWPDSLRQSLRDWTAKNRRAVATRDRTAMAAIAVEFDAYIRAQLDARRDGTVDDNTGRLLAERVDGHPLSDEEIVSIIRNWTVAELSTIAASAGVVAAHLARHPEVQEALRIDPKMLDTATDEMQRVNSPFIASRRRATRDADIAGTTVAARDWVFVVWASANRDPRVFSAPDEFRLDRDPVTARFPAGGFARLPLRLRYGARAVRMR